MAVGDITETCFYNDTPGTGSEDLYTGPSTGYIACITSILFTNSNSAAKYVTITFDEKNGFYQISLPAKSVYQWSGLIVLTAGKKIQGLQETSSAINVCINGYLKQVS
jgi:hypothetical protein